MRSWLVLLSLAVACRQPVDADSDGFTEDEDCDDDNAAVHPGATEVCNAIDDDCDDAIDDADTGLDTTTGTEFHADADGDGFGAAPVVRTACAATTGEVEDATDCDDTDALIKPSAEEVCDGVDNDCDGAIDGDDDDTVGVVVVYTDGDGDGFGDEATARSACPGDGVDTAGDCDDANADISPDATEVCADGVDDDCDGTPDDGCPTCQLLHVLEYHDSYSSTTPLEQAATLLGASVEATDDAATFANAYATETWDAMVIDVPGAGMPADVASAVTGRVSAGGQVLFSWWNLSSDAALQATLGVDVDSDYTTPLAFEDEADLFVAPQSVPDPMSAFSDEAGVDGQLLTPVVSGSSQVLARYVTEPAYPAVLTTRDGQVMINTFLPWDWQTSDADVDGDHDMAELYVNELVRLTGCVP